MHHSNTSSSDVYAMKSLAFSVLPLLVDGSIISDPQGKAAVLSDQFRSVFTLEDTSNIPNLDGNTFASMSAISISSRGIQAELDNFDPNKAQGPD